MPTYTVHAPPAKNGAAPTPEQFRFVRDGFHFWAFLVPPLWLLLKRQWIAFVIFAAAYGALMAVLSWLGVSPSVTTAVSFLVGILAGFEAPSVLRWTLARRRWATLGFVVGDDQESAERNFFAQWVNRPLPPVAQDAIADEPPPSYTSPMRRGAPSAHDVIGLFPEPGNSR